MVPPRLVLDEPTIPLSHTLIMSGSFPWGRFTGMTLVCAWLKICHRASALLILLFFFLLLYVISRGQPNDISGLL